MASRCLLLGVHAVDNPAKRVLSLLDSARDPGSELPDGWEQGDKVEYFFDGSDRWQAAGNRDGGKNTGTEVILLLPAVTVVSFLSGSALPDGFTYVPGLRFVVPEALRRPSGQLLRQRQFMSVPTWRRTLLRWTMEVYLA